MKKKLVKQKTLNVMIFSAMFLVLVFVIINTVILRQYMHREVKAERQKSRCEMLCREILDASDSMTNEMRCFVVTGNAKYLENYWKERYVTKSHDNAIARLEETNLTGKERKCSQISKGIWIFSWMWRYVPSVWQQTRAI